MWLFSLVQTVIIQAIWFLVFLLILLLLIAHFTKPLQESALYLPTVEEGRSKFINPAEIGIVDSEEIVMNTPDGVRLAGIRLPALGEAKYSIVYLHGNSGNITWLVSIGSQLRKHLDASVLLVDYRGYGKSSDELPVTEDGLMLDAETAVQYALRRDPSLPLVLVGHSLGAAISVRLCGQSPLSHSISAVILDNPFTSISNMVDAIMIRGVQPVVQNGFDRLYTLVWLLKSLMLRISWSPVEEIKAVSAPILVLSGLDDEIVPSSQHTTVHTAAINSVYRRIKTFEGGTHNDTDQCEGYYQEIRNFLDECTRTKHTPQGHYQPAEELDLI